MTTDTNELTLDLVHLAAVRQHLQLKTALFDITGAEKLPKTDVFIAADCMYNKAVAKVGPFNKERKSIKTCIIYVHIYSYICLKT